MSYIEKQADGCGNFGSLIARMITTKKKYVTSKPISFNIFRKSH